MVLAAVTTTVAATPDPRAKTFTILLPALGLLALALELLLLRVGCRLGLDYFLVVLPILAVEAPALGRAPLPAGETVAIGFQALSLFAVAP